MVPAKAKKVIKVILQLISIRFLAHGYIWWMGIEVVMAFITSYVLDYNIRKEYPWLNPQVSKGKLLQKKYPGIINKTAAASIFKWVII